MRLVDDSASFREWGANEFGRYWYRIFFDGYVRKTWVTDPDDIASDWANQRIKPIGWHRRGDEASAADAFRYPRFGPGQLWEAAAATLADRGVRPSFNSPVHRVRFDGRTWTLELRNGDTASGDAVFSSMPLQALVDALEPAPPEDIRAVAASLKHRALITVAVALREHHDIPYNWVYLPGREFQAGRVQNYGLWSGELTPEHWNGTYLGFEYFVGPDGDLMTADDERMRGIVEEDLRALGIDSEVAHVMVVRSPFAYPVYDPAREESVARIGDFLRRNYPTLHPIGRNGMHRYDNQDHAMLSAMHSVARYFGENVDPWQVNTERGYHERGLLRS
jgi:UDP-galactopyranose mutase